MTFKAIVGIVLGAMLANNYALEKFLGAAPLLGWSAQEKKITALGVSVTVAMVLTALIAGLVQTYVLDKLSLGYLQTLVFAAIVLIVIYAMNAVAKAAFKKDLGVYFPVIALNSAVLGLAVNNAADALSLGESILTALGAGLGFWLALAAFAAVRSKIRERYVPKAWRGLPIYLLTAAILSMALLAFGETIQQKRKPALRSADRRAGFFTGFVSGYRSDRGYNPRTHDRAVTGG